MNIYFKFFKAFTRTLIRRVISDSKKSYAQCGEDLIIDHLIKVVGIKELFYLDLGAHHPTYLSNTYYFYEKGFSGVCVEGDPSLIKAFEKIRKRDIILNLGVGLEKSVLDFYLMSSKTLNTFSKAEALRYVSYGNQQIEKVIKVEIETVNSIIKNFCKRVPNLISLDVEGLDFMILQSFDFDQFRPEIFCIETLSYTEDKTERKITEIIELMNLKGYMVYADTYINTIFVDKSIWANR
ncbi:fkbM_fam, methyltransferase, FkbM family [Candidatus Methylopumilus planktonicus]|uniref:FkbM family methyltransferase n=1 Tax=Candidatus Methylopumilus planktonicus TaxID=1581557 RepID=UPI003BEF1742